MQNTTLDELAKEILADVVADFRLRNLGVEALSTEYPGPSISALIGKFCSQRNHSQVDFDLALQELEDSKFLDTGPTVAHDNVPGSQVFVLGFYSKREFVYLSRRSRNQTGRYTSSHS